MKWYIDAFDGLGGLAFASYRTADLTGGEIDFGTGAWLIEAPDFRPQPVASRAIGFAATGRGFQIGFSTDGEAEEAFASLDALSDFVRRTYLSGGGGDGAGGIVGPGGGPPEGGDGDSPMGEPPQSLLPYAEELMSYAKRHQGLSEARQESERETDKEERLSVPAPEPVEDLGPLRQAFDLIVSELRATDRENDVARLLGLDWFAPYDLHRHSDDPLDVLALLPIPDFVCRSSEGRREAWRSIKDLFFGLLANPSLIVSAKYPYERIGLFLFAAAAQVHRGRLYPLVLEPRWELPGYASLMTDVFEWLAPQMPRYAFTTDVETAIRDVVG